MSSSEVSAVCEKCDAAIPEANAFCIRCGAARTTAHADDSRRFCAKCGSALGAGTKFCEKCGRQVSQGAASVSANPRPAVVPLSPPASSEGKPVKLLMVGGAVFVFLLILVMGSCAYSAYRTRQKAHAIEEAYKREEITKSAPESAANSSSNTSGPVSPSQPLSTSEPASSGTSDSAPAPAAAPAVPIAASGNQEKDWALKYERTENAPEADLVVRTGDINNLGFGWPQGFDPFSGKSTPPHKFPWVPGADEPEGTDRIMFGSAVNPAEALKDIRLYNSYSGDGYSGVLSECEMLSEEQTCKQRLDSLPQPVSLPVGKLPAKINAVLVQLFVDDFQSPVFHSHFQVSLNGTRIPSFEYSINSLNQTGPIGKLLSMELLPEYWPLLQTGDVKLLIDDPTTKRRDGYAIDFARILVNPHQFKYEVSLAASVIDADRHTPIPGASVTAGPQSASTDSGGRCQLSGLPAGLVTATGAAPGYDEYSVPVDLIAGEKGSVEIPLHRHDEGTAALERSIAQTGSRRFTGSTSTPIRRS